MLTDVRDLLPAIQAPTLVLQRAHDHITRPELGRYLVDHIRDARYVELDGSDHLWFTENADELVGQIEAFLTGARALPDPDRRLATVLFTDIAGSTARAAALGGHEVDNAGEMEVRGDRIGGLAVHIGARVAAAAVGGEILVSSTVKDLLAGSGLTFTESR